MGACMGLVYVPDGAIRCFCSITQLRLRDESWHGILSSHCAADRRFLCLLCEVVWKIWQVPVRARTFLRRASLTIWRLRHFLFDCHAERRVILSGSILPLRNPACGRCRLITGQCGPTNVHSRSPGLLIVADDGTLIQWPLRFFWATTNFLKRTCTTKGEIARYSTSHGCLSRSSLTPFFSSDPVSLYSQRFQLDCI
ncbi:hypothetical protein PENSPDRAFT_55186 [Peniophora sp. CONT]|nr:hypothetical protein PENSPDRAFT_55186 [Peniophora sp. CONT]